MVNPVFPEDCFTDRWPENLHQQDDYAGKLTALADGLEYVKRHGSSLEDTQDWLRSCFGSHVVSSSIRVNGFAWTSRTAWPSRPQFIGMARSRLTARTAFPICRGQLFLRVRSDPSTSRPDPGPTGCTATCLSRRCNYSLRR